MNFWWQSFFKPKQNPEKDLNALVGALQLALGDQLKSVVVFGSMARDEFEPKRSNVNVLLVASLSFEELRKMSPAMQAWLKKGHVPPILVSREELHRFAGAFPIEFTDMKDHYKVLFGADPIAQLAVDKTHLRAQCEHDLALLQLRLRQAIAASGGDSGKLQRALPAFRTSLRTLARAAAGFDQSPLQSDKIKASGTLDSAAQLLKHVESILHSLKK